VAVTSGFSGASQYLGIDRWEEMQQIQGTNDFKGVCMNYKNVTKDALWIIARCAAVTGVILGGSVAALVWRTIVSPMTRVGWKVLLFFVLLCSFIEISMIIFYYFSSACLANPLVVKSRTSTCSFSVGGFVAIAAAVTWLMTCVTMWYYPPFLKYNRKEKVDELLGDLQLCSKRGLIELNELSSLADRAKTLEETTFDFGSEDIASPSTEPERSIGSYNEKEGTESASSPEKAHDSEGNAELKPIELEDVPLSFEESDQNHEKDLDDSNNGRDAKYSYQAKRRGSTESDIYDDVGIVNANIV